MGWDTEVVILAEGMMNKVVAKQLSYDILDSDAKHYGISTTYFMGTDVLFYHYERRKYAPYWIIQGISKEYPNVQFTILASCPEFAGGPSGLMRIKEGEIIDSYGIGDLKKEDIRTASIANPLLNITFIYEWFRSNGPEEKERMSFLAKYPIGWCKDNFVEKIIPIPETSEMKRLYGMNSKDLKKSDWIKLNKTKTNNE